MCKCLSFNDAIYLLHEREKAMQEAVPVGREHDSFAWEDIKIIKKLIEETKLNETGVCEIATIMRMDK